MQKGRRLLLGHLTATPQEVYLVRALADRYIDLPLWKLGDIFVIIYNNNNNKSLVLPDSFWVVQSDGSQPLTQMVVIFSYT